MKNAFLILALLFIQNQTQAFFLHKGTPIKEGQLPQIGSLSFNGGICTAQLVGPKVFATAAHCCFPNTEGITFFTLSPEEGYDVVKTRIHSQYYIQGSTPNFAYDICLGVLNKEVKNVAPLTISAQAVDDAKFEYIEIGNTQPENETEDSILNLGYYNYFNFYNEGKSHGGLFYGSGGGRPGDSGGALLFRDKADQTITLSGVTSTQLDNEGMKVYCHDQKAKAFYAITNKKSGEDVEMKCFKSVTEAQTAFALAQKNYSADTHESILIPLDEMGTGYALFDGKLDFINDFIKSTNTKICGINLDCDKLKF